jgi:transposase InsO family protein
MIKPNNQPFPLLVYTLASCLPCEHAMTTMPSRRNHEPKPNADANPHWIVDSGATIHCVGDRSLLTQVYTDQPPVRIRVANGQMVTAHAVGSATVKLVDDKGKKHEITLHNVVFHPSFGKHNLLSVRRLWRHNRISAHFKNTSYLKCANSNTKFPIFFDTNYSTPIALSASVDTDLLHARFGHASERRVKKLIERSLNFPKHSSPVSHDPSTCDACNAGGARRKAFPKHAGNPFTYFGERLSSDMCGPFPKSIQGYKYLFNIVDGHTNDLYTYCLRNKSSAEVRNAMAEFLNENRTLLNHGKPIRWHTDNGGEFMSHDMDEFCEEFAVRRSFSVPYAPPTNAHAERMWSTILRPMRVMLAASHVHESFWPYAAAHATYLHNIMPSTRLAGEISPHQAKYGTKPDVSKVRVWGCTCWYLLPKHEISNKVSPRALPAVHLGLDPVRKGYIVYIPELNRITTAYHVTFQERKFLTFTHNGVINAPRRVNRLREHEVMYPDKQYQPPAPPANHYSDDRDDDDRDDEPDDQDGRPNNSAPCSHPKCTKSTHPDSEPHSFEDLPTRDKGRSPRLNPRIPADADLVMLLEDVSNQGLAVRTEDLLTDIVTPNGFSDAKKSKDFPRWQESMNKEIEDLIKHGTWVVLDRRDVPKGRKITKSRWVYKVKLNRDGSIERFKSRFVVCGYSQVKGADYTHSFSATMRATSLRLLLALAAGERLKLEHFDVTSAFTQADIDSDIYVEPPQGYPEYNGKVLKLVKALYGTKQASRMWQLKLREKLIEMGFSNSPHDPCLFSRRTKDGSVMLIGVYVDDIVLAHNERELDWFIREFTGPKGFNAKHVGPLNWFLGMGITQTAEYTVKIDQSQYLDKLVERFVPTNKGSVIKHAMPCNTLTFSQLSTAQTEAERDKAARLPYLQLIGSLLYLTMTRPDICYYMSILCSFMHDPSPACYYAAIDLLLYIVHSSDTHITFTGSTAVPRGVDAGCHGSIVASGGLLAYSDSSWRRPDRLGFNSFGYVIYLFGAPVSFASKRLKVIAHSSAEAEYAACSYACREVVFVRNVLGDLGFQISGPTVVAVDNQAAIKIAENMGVTSRTKHFGDAIHYLRHLVDHRVVSLTFVRTDAQHADGFTKPLGKTPFRVWCKMLYRE